jgi:hypothetical protein
MLTHAVYDVLTGETKSEHPDASSAFAAASKIGGERYGYVVGPINCPPDPKKVESENREKASMNRVNREGPKKPDQEGPGLFD